MPYSQTSTTVDIGSNEPRIIRIPPSLHDVPLCFTFIDYLQSTSFIKLSSTTKRNRTQAINLFFQHLIEELNEKSNSIPNDTFRTFAQFIKRETNRNSNSVAETVSHVVAGFKWFYNHETSKDKSYWKDDYDKLIANLPSFTKSPNTPKPSLIDLFGECPFDNTEMIRSLRLICCWTINEFERHRNILLKNEKINLVLAETIKMDIQQPPLLYARTQSAKKDKHLLDSSHELYGHILESVIESDDATLIERLYQNNTNPFSDDNDIHQMISWLKKWKSYNNPKSRLRSQFNHKGKHIFLQRIQTLTYAQLLSPSDVEVFCIQCFFATERIQLSNLERMKISDIQQNEQGKQAQHIKGRRRRSGVTQVYKKGSVIDSALNIYLTFLQKNQHRLPVEMRGLFLPYFESNFNSFGQIGRTTNAFSLFFSLLINQNSNLHRAMKKDIGNDSEPILWIISRIIKQNKKVSIQESKYAKEWRYQHHNVPRKSIVTEKRIALSADFIGRSREAMDGKVDVYVKGDHITPEFQDDMVSAELTNHSPKTKANIYNDRSQSPEKILSMRNFAVQVGEAMERDAAKMTALMNKTTVVDLQEARAKLGIKDSVQDFNQLLDLAGNSIDVGLIGEFTVNDNETIIVIDALTAALITLRISHISSEVPRLMLDSDEKAIRAIADKAYLEKVIMRFPDSTRLDGEELAKKIDIKFASLI